MLYMGIPPKAEGWYLTIVAIIVGCLIILSCSIILGLLSLSVLHNLMVLQTFRWPDRNMPH